MKPSRLTTCVLALGLTALPGSVGVRMTRAAAAPERAANDAARIERGAYLVRALACNDCHTPWKLGPRGPEPDMTRALTGHPQDLVMPPPPKLPEGPWAWIGATTNTAFAGPWGVSYTANLTPDPETGLGNWTPEMFIATMRTGRRQGKGRPLLPPMPAPMIANLSDEDLRSIFAYLQSLPANRVPAPIDPPEKEQ